MFWCMFVNNKGHKSALFFGINFVNSVAVLVIESLVIVVMVVINIEII